MSLRLSHRVVRLTVFAVALVVMAGWDAHSAPSPNEKAIRIQFANTIALYRQGEYNECAAAFDVLLEMKPAPALIATLRDEVGFKPFFDMLRRKDRSGLAAKAKAFLDVAERAVLSKKLDGAAIKTLADQLAAEPTERWKAVYELRAIGAVAVPHILEYFSKAKLGTYSDVSEIIAHRAAAIISIRRMGRRAVLPLVQALKCQDEAVRQTVVTLLGEIKDPRSVPGLKAIMENREEEPRLQQAAAEALAATTDTDPAALPRAEELYRQMAESYVAQSPETMGYLFEPETPLWGFNPEGKGIAGQVVHRRIPAYIYAFEMAQSACLDGLQINPDYERLGTMMLANYFATRVRLQALIAAHGQRVTGAKVLGYTDADAKQRLQRLGELDVLSMAPGKAVLYRVLQRALAPRSEDDDQPSDPEVALQAIEALVRLGDDRHETEQSPLIRALSCRYTRVRFDAANALMAISPSGAMLPGDEERDAVLRALIAALTELSSPAVLVVDHDVDVRERFRGLISAAGYAPVTAPDGSTCQDLARNSFPRISLVLVASDLKGFDAAALGKVLQDDANTRDIPLLLMAAAQRGEKPMEKPKPYAGVIAKNIPANSLTQKLAQVLKQHKPTQAAKQRALALVRQTLATLNTVDPKATLYPMDRTVPALMDLVLGQPLDIRIGATTALAKIGSRTAMAPILSSFADTKTPKKLRLVLAEAIGRIFLDGGDVLTPEEFAVLSKTMKEKDRDIRLAASRALGRASAIPSATMEVLRDHRIR